MTSPKTKTTKVKATLVVAALVWHGDRLLIAQRKADSTIGANQWEFPGGKVAASDADEAAALKRELREELGLEIAVGERVAEREHSYETPAGPKRFKVLFYECYSTTTELELLDVQDARWVSVKELDEYDFVDGDRPIIAKALAGSGAKRISD